MPIHNLSENTIIVQLPPKPYTTNELELTGKIALGKPDCNVAVDCSKIGLATCMALCGFMKLRKALVDRDRRLIFLNVGPVLRGVFSVYGFDQIFTVAYEPIVIPSSSEDSQCDETELPCLAKDDKRPQQRNYERLKVCESCELEVSLWHKTGASDEQHTPIELCFRGRLLDVSLGGAQIGLNAIEEHNFRKKQTIRLEFKAYQTSFLLDAQIREVLPTADGRGICLGVEFIRVKSNSESQLILEQFCESIERYWLVEETLPA